MQKVGHICCHSYSCRRIRAQNVMCLQGWCLDMMKLLPRLLPDIGTLDAGCTRELPASGRQPAASTAGREYFEDLCMKAVNQCIGRVIRYRGDWAAILLVDVRWTAGVPQPACGCPMKQKLLHLISMKQQHLPLMCHACCSNRGPKHTGAKAARVDTAEPGGIFWLWRCIRTPCSIREKHQIIAFVLMVLIAIAGNMHDCLYSPLL